MSIEIAKKAAGIKAAELVEDGMIVGLGTGSTSAYFIEALIKKRAKIEAVASSLASADMAKKGGLLVRDINDVSHIDLTVDGADEIDPQKRMIKGGGGAHVREKILAASSRKMVVIIDASKKVNLLGKAKLPIEIFPFGAPFTIQKIEALGFSGSLRKKGSQMFVTDNGNWLFDLSFPDLLQEPEKVHAALIALPGVVDTGFFFNLASEVIIGHLDGSVSINT